MKKCIVVLFFMNLNWHVSAQTISVEKQKIQALLEGFMEAIQTRDSGLMYSFFADVPVTWVGVWRPATQHRRLSKDSQAAEFRISDFKTWFRSITTGLPRKELFRNAVIVEDGTIGSVTFDYSFWTNEKKGNWGKESWGMIKQKGEWKIASVLFSMDLESVKSENDDKQILEEIRNSKIESYMQSIAESMHFQGTVLVAKGDSIIHHAAYGMFDIENRIPNEVNTQFLIGSLTKSFVAIAIMKLVEDKKVDLQLPVVTYLPALKKELASGLTIHYLLKQQSGLERSFDNLTEYTIMDITAAELLDIINKSKRSFEPGTKYEYTNINYALLAMIIESVTGMDYHQYLKQNIFDVAGMKHTGMERLTNMPTNRANGYRTVNGIFRRVHNVVSYAYGAGDIYSTAFDIFKWSKALRELRLLNRVSLSNMLTPSGKNWGYYGYGFRIQPYQTANDQNSAGKMIRHGGTMNGFISNYHFYEDDNLTVVILSNYRDIPIRNITYQLKELALGYKLGERKNKYKE